MILDSFASKTGGILQEPFRTPNIRVARCLRLLKECECRVSWGFVSIGSERPRERERERGRGRERGGVVNEESIELFTRS